MGLELSRWMVALGSVAAAVGLTVFGMATSTLHPMDDLVRLGIILMIAGGIVFIVGMLAHHRLDESDTSTDY